MRCRRRGRSPRAKTSGVPAREGEPATVAKPAALAESPGANETREDEPHLAKLASKPRLNRNARQPAPARGSTDQALARDRKGSPRAAG